MVETAQKPARAKDIAKRVYRHENVFLGIILLALIGVMAGATKGLSIRPSNMVNMLWGTASRAVASVGQTFVLLSGGIDVSVAGVGLFSSTLSILMMTQSIMLNIVGHPISVYAGIPIMLLIGAGWGAINGLAVSRLGMPPLIVTLAMWEVSKGAAFLLSRGRSLGDLPVSFAFFGSGKVAGVPVPVILVIVVVVIAYFVLHYTRFGRSVYAVGGNPASAWLSGMSVRNIQFLVYVISGLVAGLAGVVVTARSMLVTMRTLGGLELDSIAAVCVGGVSLMGGRGTLIGAMIGVLIMGVITNGLTILGAGTVLQGIVRGATIIAAVTIDYMRRR